MTSRGVEVGRGVLKALLEGIVAGGMGDGITKCDWWWKAKVEAAEGDVVVGGEKPVRSSFKRF